jgi:hypothetical protein
MKKLIATALLAAPFACYADSSYEHTTQITGGQLINSLKNIPFMGKQMRALSDPQVETTMVHGNQKAIVGKDYTEIWDLDKEVIIHIDNIRKTYSVVTFADMRKMMEEMPAKMAEMQEKMNAEQAKMQQQQDKNTVPPNLKFSFSVDVKDTGLIKMIDRYNAKQQILTMKAIVTDTNNPGTNITYSFTDEIWTTPEVPAEMKEVEEFDKRFGRKLMQGVDLKDVLNNMASMRNNSQMSMMQLFGSKPGAGDAFVEMGKELSKIKGTRVLEITRMGGAGTGMQAQPGDAPPPPTAGQVAGQTASDSASNHFGLAGQALGGLMGGFGHKKKQDPPPAAAAPATQTTTEVTLMEMTTQTHNFSNEPVSSASFQVPAGYKQVESPMEQMMNKK